MEPMTPAERWTQHKALVQKETDAPFVYVAHVGQGDDSFLNEVSEILDGGPLGNGGCTICNQCGC